MATLEFDEALLSLFVGEESVGFKPRVTVAVAADSKMGMSERLVVSV